MATFEELDGLLAEALQCLNDAAGLVRELTQLETKPSLMHLGHAINEAWELRGHVHRIRPDLKPPFVVEYEEDRVRYNKLSEISKKAHQLEDSGRSSEARGKFLDLRAASVRGYFKWWPKPVYSGFQKTRVAIPDCLARRTMRLSQSGAERCKSSQMIAGGCYELYSNYPLQIPTVAASIIANA